MSLASDKTAARAVSSSITGETLAHIGASPKATVNEIAKIYGTTTHKEGNSLVATLGELNVAEMPGGRDRMFDHTYVTKALGNASFRGAVLLQPEATHMTPLISYEHAVAEYEAITAGYDYEPPEELLPDEYRV